MFVSIFCNLKICTLNLFDHLTLLVSYSILTYNMIEVESTSNPEQLVDPVKLARRTLNQELFNTATYDGGAILLKTIELKNALVNSTLERQRVYLELSIVARQGAQRAKMNNDNFTMLIFRELKNGYELAYENSSPMQRRQDIVKTPDPRATSTLPLKCRSCDNEWQYKGKNQYATCPNCRHNVKTGLRKE